jgi:multicomponent Na+:H+ antiporter subunit E
MILFLTLLAIWIILSGYFTAIPLIPGIIALLFVPFFMKKAKRVFCYPFTFSINTIELLKYLPYIIKEIFVSDVNVAKLVLQNKHKGKIIKVPHTLQSKSLVTTFSNSITLTPGSITLDAKDNYLLVHVIDENVEDGMLSNDLLNRVKKLENKKHIGD